MKRSLEKYDPKIIKGVPHACGEEALLRHPPSRAVHGQAESELDPPGRLHAPGDICVFAVEIDIGVVTTYRLQGRPPQDEIAALEHAPLAEDEMIQKVCDISNDVESPCLEPVKPRKIVIDKGARKGRKSFVFGKFLEDSFEPSLGEHVIGIDV